MEHVDRTSNTLKIFLSRASVSAALRQSLMAVEGASSAAAGSAVAALSRGLAIDGLASYADLKANVGGTSAQGKRRGSHGGGSGGSGGGGAPAVNHDPGPPILLKCVLETHIEKFPIGRNLPFAKVR